MLDSDLELPVTLDWRDDETIAIVTLNRPRVRNAINGAMADAVIETLGALRTRPTLRCLILQGAGSQAFSAGADLVERRGLPAAGLTAHTDVIADAAHALADFPVATIAAVRGYALAGGAEWAIACDLRVFADDAVIGFPEVRIGVFPGAGGVVRLPRLVGESAARDLLLTGRRIEAAEAWRLGLADRLVTAADVESTALAVARTIAKNAPLAVRAIKRTLSETVGVSEPIAHAISRRLRQPLDATDDYREGLSAFAEKRPANFSGS